VGDQGSPVVAQDIGHVGGETIVPRRRQRLGASRYLTGRFSGLRDRRRQPQSSAGSRPSARRRCPSRHHHPVRNAGTLMLARAIVTGNHAGFGGSGIQNVGTLTLIDVTVTENSGTGAGGGICNGCGSGLPPGMLTVVNSTVSNNAATDAPGGGISNGGIVGGGGTVRLTNVTVSGNTAPLGSGGGLHQGSSGPVTLLNVTLNGNSASGAGGIAFVGTGTITAKNTIVASGLAAGTCSGALVSAGHNLDSSNNCGLTAAGDISNIDPKLDPLGNNGGPPQHMPCWPGVQPSILVTTSAAPPPTSGTWPGRRTGCVTSGPLSWGQH
jgi:hypothetical protein